MRIISRRPAAVARLKGSAAAPLLRGAVRFYQLPAGVLAEAEVSGLPNNSSGFYGFHIHTGGSCDGGDFSGAGGHFDPQKQPHPRHAGDLPPLLRYGSRAYMCVVTDRFSIGEILGRTVVLHAMPDDLITQPAGNSAERIGCGVIVRGSDKM